VISQSEIHLLDNTQHSLETNIYPYGGTRTRNANTRVPVNPRLRTHGHWNLQKKILNSKNTREKKSVGNAFLILTQIGKYTVRGSTYCRVLSCSAVYCGIYVPKFKSNQASPSAGKTMVCNRVLLNPPTYCFLFPIGNILTNYAAPLHRRL